MAVLHVPVELIEEILSRVQVKSLLRFKTASKYWYCLLSRDLKFANLHLKQQSKNPLLFFQVFPGGTTFQSFNIDTNESRVFSFPVRIECQLVGATNGLICVAPCHKRSFYIWNPCTGECEEISMDYHGIEVFGFAYDSHSDDYKVVAKGEQFFHIFSFKTNSWKILKNYVPNIVKALQFNGALHWCHLNDIIAFDLVEEKFFFIELPDEIKPIAKQYQSLAVSLWEYQGFLCVSRGKSIWAMKKYRDTKSWVKLSQCLVENEIPLGISRLGEVVYRTKDGYVRSDIQGRMSDYDKLRRIYVQFPSAFVYTESLISVAALLNPSLIDLFNSRELKYIWTKEKIAKLLQAVREYGGFKVNPSRLLGALEMIFKQSGSTFGLTREEVCSRMKTEREIMLSCLGKKTMLKVRKKGKGKGKVIGKKKDK